MASFYYNLKGVGDVLLVKVKYGKTATSSKNFEKFSVVFHKEEVIAYNFFNISSVEEIKENGVIYNVTPSLLDYVNNELSKEGFEKISEIEGKKFKVGKVISCEDIEGTHLHLCQVDIKEEVLQIVCGAKNVCKDALVVVAMIGCLMPDSTLIKEGTLKGYKSYGMLCSKRELGIPCEEVRGLYLLDDSYEIGQDFIA